LIWVTFRIVMKALDCLQAFLAGVGQLPRSFFLLLLLVIPLSADSIGAQWIGYMVAALSLLGLAAVGVLVVVAWKYGVDQALRLVDHVRAISRAPDTPSTSSSFPPENQFRPEIDPPPMNASPQTSSRLAPT
jgi:hypothetical protein